MRVLFAGSPRVAVPTLMALHESEHTVVGVLTQPPRPFGRTKELRGTPVFDYAQEHGLACAVPQSAEGIAQFAADVKADIAVVVAYGRILSAAALEAVPGGWWNVHFSLLPALRGASPVAHTILKGVSTTGLSLFKIVEELDAGPLVMQQEHRVAFNDTTGTLLSKLGALAPVMVMDFLNAPERFPLREQEGLPSYAPKFPQGFGLLNLSRPVEPLYQHFRAVTPEPGAFVRRADNGTVLKILATWPDPDYHALEPGQLLKAPMGILLGTATAPLVLERVQPEGKKPMEAVDWYRGLPAGVTIEPGEA